MANDIAADATGASATGAGASANASRTLLERIYAEDERGEEGVPNEGAAGADEEDEAQLGPRLWEGDAGTLPYDARNALLRLVKGPYISEGSDPALWRELLNYTPEIRSRLADLFLELCIDAEAGVAFAKNATSEERDLPKAATSYTMTLLDTIMVLLLRKELQTAGSRRVFIGKADLFAQMGQYRAIEKMDQSAFLKRLESSWTRLAERRLIVKSDVEGRFEISPVLKLVFGTEEAAAVLEEYEHMKEQMAKSSDAGIGAGATSAKGQAGFGEADGEREVTLFDGLD